MHLLKRLLALAAVISFLLLLLPMPANVCAQTPRDLGFEVVYPQVRDLNETHVDFGLKLKVTNNGKYDDFVYKMSFYIINASGVYYFSKTPGSFKLYSQMFRIFTINFTIPRSTAEEIDRIYYEDPDGDNEQEFPLSPQSRADQNAKEIEAWEIIVMVSIGIVFLGVLGLIYMITSYTKKKQRKKKYLRY